MATPKHTHIDTQTLINQMGRSLSSGEVSLYDKMVYEIGLLLQENPWMNPA